MKILILLLVTFRILPASAQIQAVSRRANRVLIFTNKPEIWSLRPWRQRVRINAQISSDYAPSAAALSRDGKLVALGHEGATLELFETHSGHLWKRLGKHQVWQKNEKNNYRKIAVSALAFSPGRRLLASGNNKGVFVWRMSDGKLLFSRPLRFFQPHDRAQSPLLDPPSQLLFSPDGRTLAVGGFGCCRSDYRPLFLLNVKGKRLRHIENFYVGDGEFEAFAFSPGGNRLLVASYWNISGSSFSQIHLFDSRSGHIIWKEDNAQSIDPKNKNGPLDETHESTDSAAFSSDGRRIAVSGPEYLEIRQARNGHLLNRKSSSEKQSQTTDFGLRRARRFRAELALR